MKISTAMGCVVALCAAFAGNNVNAASSNFSGQLDLMNTGEYSVPIDGEQVPIAVDLIRLNLGSGWTGEMDMQLTTGSYFNTFTTLGFALATDPNDALYGDPSPFLQLVNATTSQEVTDFFTDNVDGWVFYGYGSPYISPGGTSNLTDSFNPSLQFDPNEHYYAFLAGGSVMPTTVDVNLEVSSVPIPAAVWLFGSGIVGLIGASKRKRA